MRASSFDTTRRWHRARNHRVALERIRGDGRRAAADGRTEDDCPYVTNAAGFRPAWIQGLREPAGPAPGST